MRSFQSFSFVKAGIEGLYRPCIFFSLRALFFSRDKKMNNDYYGASADVPVGRVFRTDLCPALRHVTVRVILVIRASDYSARQTYNHSLLTAWSESIIANCGCRSEGALRGGSGQASEHHVAHRQERQDHHEDDDVGLDEEHGDVLDELEHGVPFVGGCHYRPSFTRETNLEPR